MNPNSTRLKKYQIAVVLAGVFTSGFLLLIVANIFRPGTSIKQNAPSLLPTPTIYQTTSTQPLTQEEQRFPEPSPQEYYTKSDKTGTLTITTSPPDTTILIDPIFVFQPEAPAATTKQNYTEVPKNNAPLKITSLPLGEHRVIASKKGYYSSEVTFIIEEGKVTRLNLALKAIE